MKNWVLFLILLIFSKISLAAPFKFYGEVAQEFKLKFSSVIELKSNHRITIEDLKKSSSKSKLVQEKINSQIEHLIGYFQSIHFENLYKVDASIDMHFKINYMNVTKVGPSIYSIEYTFQGKGVTAQKFFNSNSVRDLELRLPKNPDTIYRLGLVNGINRCTDRDYNSKDDFFYFWDLDLPGCPLNKQSKAVLTLKAQTEALPNTDRTFPEYDKLYDGEKNIFLFIGYLNDEIIPGRVNRRDRAHAVYQELVSWFQKNNFKVVTFLDNVRGDILNNRRVIKGGNKYHLLQLEVDTELGNRVIWNLHMLLADTSYDSNDETFRTMYAKALEHGSLVVYDGHSGLGANIDLTALPSFDFKKMEYQILYLNGCSSYPYFKSPYFKAKGGSKKLDIITSGLPTLDSTSVDNIIAFLNPFILGKTFSYQKILKNIELSNGTMHTYLTAVNGDEDNEWGISQ